MKLLIVEDEPPIAEHIEWMCQKILGDKFESCFIVHTLDDALKFIQKKPLDIMLLDLNLEGESGFDILKEVAAGSFHTIIISAHAERAITAYEYGVLDFIPKPFKEERLKNGFDRYFNRINNRELDTKYLSCRENNEIYLIKIKDILFFKSVGNYVEANLKNGKTKWLLKSLNKLEQILPSHFFRNHRSFIVDKEQITTYKHVGGGSYQVELENGVILPLSRAKCKALKQELKS